MCAIGPVLSPARWVCGGLAKHNIQGPGSPCVRRLWPMTSGECRFLMASSFGRLVGSGHFAADAPMCLHAAHKIDWAEATHQVMLP